MRILSPSHLLEGVWRIDRPRSSVGFRARHFGVATVRGHFESFSGRIDGLKVAADVDVASVQTGNGIRDARLRSEFFAAERHPTSRFAGELRHGRLSGLLTVRGVTRPIDLDVTVEDGGDETLHVRADGKLRRSDFGLEWDALRDAGRLLVADEVRLVADVVLRPA